MTRTQQNTRTRKEYRDIIQSTDYTLRRINEDTKQEIKYAPLEFGSDIVVVESMGEYSTRIAYDIKGIEILNMNIDEDGEFTFGQLTEWKQEFKEAVMERVTGRRQSFDIVEYNGDLELLFYDTYNGYTIVVQIQTNNRTRLN